MGVCFEVKTTNSRSNCFRVTKNPKMVNTKKVTPVPPITVPKRKGEKKDKLVKDDVKGKSLGEAKGYTKVGNTFIKPPLKKKKGKSRYVPCNRANRANRDADDTSNGIHEHVGSRGKVF